jgi:hypothetical protein
MTSSAHGIAFGIERMKSNIFLTCKATGKLTHDDYSLFTPMLESALTEVKSPKCKMLFDGTEFEGWELRAAWDDFKIGLKHGNEFEKIAILGNKKWLELASKVGSWFTSGEIRYFEDRNEAYSWLQD